MHFSEPLLCQPGSETLPALPRGLFRPAYTFDIRPFLPACFPLQLFESCLEAMHFFEEFFLNLASLLILLSAKLLTEAHLGEAILLTETPLLQTLLGPVMLLPAKVTLPESILFQLPLPTVLLLQAPSFKPVTERVPSAAAASFLVQLLLFQSALRQTLLFNTLLFQPLLCQAFLLQATLLHVLLS